MKGFFRQIVLVAMALLVGFSPAMANAQGIDVEKAARVKAAYLLNFVRYTQWPGDAFDRPDSPILLTAVGECPGAAVLAEVVRRSEPINGRRLLLRHVNYTGEEASREELYRLLEESHLVYVCSLGPEPLSSMLTHVSDAKVLTVGDTPDFASAGGMLGFVFHDNRIVFQANPRAIQKSRVTVSAKVLKLAQIVENPEAP